MILLFFVSLFIADKWKGNLTKCGFIGMAIYVSLNTLAGCGKNYAEPIAGGVTGFGTATIFSLFLIWLPVWIIMFRRRNRSKHESWDRTAIYGAKKAKDTEATDQGETNLVDRLKPRTFED
jgi:hypothetical protein